MNPSLRRTLAGLAAFVPLVTLVSCGDDDDDDAGGSGSAETIRVFTFTSEEGPIFSAPQVGPAVEARIEAINADGGINGKQVEWSFCDTRSDPNAEAACAREAVTGGFDAVVASDSLFPNTLPVLEAAKMPFIGGRGITPTELNSPISFPIGSGVPGWMYGATALALDAGVQRPGMVTTNQSSAQFAAKLGKARLDLVGIPLVKTVEAPLGQPDQATAAAQLAEGTDGVMVASTAAEAIKVLQALRQSGYTAPVAGPSTTYTQADIDTLGSAAEGLLLSSQVSPVTHTDNPAVAQFVEEIDAHDPSTPKDERSMTAWAAMQLFAKVVERIDGEVTPATVLEAFTTLSDPVDIGVTGPYAVAGRTSPLPEFSRIFNPTIVFTEVRDGQIVIRNEDFVNPFEATPGS